MSYQQLLHLSPPGYFSRLCSSCMKCFFSTRCILIRKCRFMKKQVNSFYLLYDRRKIDGIRAIGITAGRSRRAGQQVVGNSFSLRCHVIGPILYTIQFVYRHLVEIDHFTDNMVRTLLFCKQKATTRHTMTQRNGSNRQRTVFINQHRFFRIKLMEKDLVRHLSIKKVQHRCQQCFQPFWRMDMQLGCTS